MYKPSLDFLSILLITEEVDIWFLDYDYPYPCVEIQLIHAGDHHMMMASIALGIMYI